MRRRIMAPHYDAAIIGTGQAGPPLANRLTQAGMKVVRCWSRIASAAPASTTGCIPTKTLVASAYAAHLAARAADYGVTIEGRVAMDMKKVKARKDMISGNSMRRRDVAARDAELHDPARPRPPRLRVRGRGRRRSGSTAERFFSTSAAAHWRRRYRGIETIDYLTNDFDHRTSITVPAASRDPRRQLYRPRIRANLPPIRRRGDGDRTGAAPRCRARMRISPRPSRIFSRAKGIVVHLEHKMHPAFETR